MTRPTLPAAAATPAATTAIAPAFAAEVAPGDTPAGDRTFSCSILDQFPMLDPQLDEETRGRHVIRRLFEGLTRQDADGPGIPAGAVE